tara:strand:+ start:19 stop:252 length:234 start_codon:yes stop_codon:yes gene_type:complete
MKIIINNKINKLSNTMVYALCEELEKELNNVVCSCKDEYSISRLLVVAASRYSEEVWVDAKLTKTNNKIKVLLKEVI